jgi:hypothetical protein
MKRRLAFCLPPITLGADQCGGEWRLDAVIGWDFRAYDASGIDGAADANGRYRRKYRRKVLAIGFERLVVANT